MLEVTIAGEPDPTTGMVLDLKELKEILQERRWSIAWTIAT